MRNKAEEKMPSTPDIANADDIKLQVITENASRIMKNFIEQLEGESSEDMPIV